MNPQANAPRSSRTASPNSIADVAVIGGGIVGAAAALAAGQAGLSTLWVVGRPGFVEATAERDQRVYALSPGTAAFLDALRVWTQLPPSRVAPVFDMRIFGDSAGRSALHFGAYESSSERLATIVEHRELARVLETAAGYFPGIERIDGSTSGVTTGADHIDITTERGARSARLVIAADGARSPTREALGIATRGRPYGQQALVGNFAAARPHRGTAFQWFTDHGVVALLPLAAAGGSTNAVSLVWSAPDTTADALVESGADAVAAKLSELASTHPSAAIGPFTALGPLTKIPLAMQTADRLIAPRAALVGDAAHVIHPLAGQGLNLGLGDVETLIGILKVRESFRDCGDRVLLRRYERARAEPVAAMREMTDGLSRLFDSARPGVARVRGLGLRALDRTSPLKRLLMRHASGGA